MAFLGENPTSVRAQNDVSRSAVASNVAAPAQHPLLDLNAEEADRHVAARPDVEDEQARGTGENATPPPNHAAAEPGTKKDEDRPHGSSAAAASEHGGGSGRTDPAPSSDLHQRVETTDSHETPNAQIRSGGAGEETKLPTSAGDDASGQSAHAPARPNQIAPWQASNWPQTVERARQAVDSGQVPTAYRDLVKDYFNRER